MTPPARRRSHLGLVLCGVVIVLAGFGVAVVEALHFPKGSIWLLVAATIVLIGLVRLLDRRG